MAKSDVSLSFCPGRQATSLGNPASCVGRLTAHNTGSGTARTRTHAPSETNFSEKNQASKPGWTSRKTRKATPLPRTKAGFRRRLPTRGRRWKHMWFFPPQLMESSAFCLAFPSSRTAVATMAQTRPWQLQGWPLYNCRKAPSSAPYKCAFPIGSQPQQLLGNTWHPPWPTCTPRGILHCHRLQFRV